MASSLGGSSLWTRAWHRAVARPAWRRAVVVWLSVGMVAGVVMGPTALGPGDVVALLWHPTAAAVGAGLWLALLHPAARILVRAEAAAYLRTLPAPRAAGALPALHLVATHAPVAALLAAGGASRAACAVPLGLAAAQAALALAPTPRRRRGAPHWRSAGAGLRAVLLARLLADDAQARAPAFAALAGGGAALLLRANQLSGASASTVALGALAVLGTPAYASVVLPLTVVSRRLWPLCATAGVPYSTWQGALATVLAAALALLAAAAALLAAAGGGVTLTDGVRLVAGGAALGATLGVAAVPIARWATASAQVTQRVMTGAVASAALVGVALATWGELGLAAALALAAAATLRLEEPALC